MKASKPLPHDDLEQVLEHAAGLWPQLRGQRIFITGGTGFFGLWLLESFLHANDRFDLKAEATVLTRNPEAFAAKAPHVAQHPAIRLHRGDVRDFIFPAGEFSCVIHAATDASAKLNAEDPQEMISVIVDGMRRVIEFAGHAKTKTLLFTSSGAVYGKQPSELTHVPEDYLGAPDSLQPTSAYGEGKRLAELLCILGGKKHGYAPKIARCFAFVGPHLPLDAHFAIGNFIRDAMRGGPVVVNGDGSPFRSYLYAADLTGHLWAVLFKGQSGRAYNIGSGDGVDIRALAQIVAEVAGNGCEHQVKLPLAPGTKPARYIPDVRRAQEELGLFAKRDLKDSIRATTAWTRN